MNGAELMQRVCETEARYLGLGNESFSAAGATFVRNRSTPRRFDANHVGLIRVETPDAVEALLQRADAEFEGYGHRRFDIDGLTPPAVEARLALDRPAEKPDVLVMILESELQASPPRVEIREVLSDADWDVYRDLDALWWDERGNDDYDASLLEEFTRSRRLKTPGVRSWFACVDGIAVAYLSSWPGENGVGLVEDLFTHPDYRHRGLATALLVHGVADARLRGAGPVVIGASVEDTPKRMYASMGFRPLYVARAYVREVAASG